MLQWSQCCICVCKWATWDTTSGQVATSFNSVWKKGFTAHSAFCKVAVIAAGTSSIFLKSLNYAGILNKGEFFFLRRETNISLVRIWLVKSEKQIKEKKKKFIGLVTSIISPNKAEDYSSLNRPARTGLHTYHHTRTRTYKKSWECQVSFGVLKWVWQTIQSKQI